MITAVRHSLCFEIHWNKYWEKNVCIKRPRILLGSSSILICTHTPITHLNHGIGSILGYVIWGGWATIRPRDPSRLLFYHPEGREHIEGICWRISGRWYTISEEAPREVDGRALRSQAWECRFWQEGCYNCKDPDPILTWNGLTIPAENPSMVLQPLCPPTPRILQIYPEVVCPQCFLSGEQGWDRPIDGTDIWRRTGISGIPRGSTECDYPIMEGTFSWRKGIVCWSCKGVVRQKTPKAHPSKVCTGLRILSLRYWCIDVGWLMPATGVG